MGVVNEVKRTDGRKGEIIQGRARSRWKDCIQRGLRKMEGKRRMRVTDRGNWRGSTEKTVHEWREKEDEKHGNA